MNVGSFLQPLFVCNKTKMVLQLMNCPEANILLLFAVLNLAIFDNFAVMKDPCLSFNVLDLSKANVVYLPRSRARWRTILSAFIHFHDSRHVGWL